MTLKDLFWAFFTSPSILFCLAISSAPLDPIIHSMQMILRFICLVLTSLLTFSLISPTAYSMYGTKYLIGTLNATCPKWNPLYLPLSFFPLIVTNEDSTIFSVNQAHGLGVIPNSLLLISNHLSRSVISILKTSLINVSFSPLTFHYPGTGPYHLTPELLQQLLVGPPAHVFPHSSLQLSN